MISIFTKFGKFLQWAGQVYKKKFFYGFYEKYLFAGCQFETVILQMNYNFFKSKLYKSIHLATRAKTDLVIYF